MTAYLCPYTECLSGWNPAPHTVNTATGWYPCRWSVFLYKTPWVFQVAVAVQKFMGYPTYLKFKTQTVSLHQKQVQRPLNSCTATTVIPANAPNAVHAWYPLPCGLPMLISPPAAWMLFRFENPPYRKSCHCWYICQHIHLVQKFIVFLNYWNSRNNLFHWINSKYDYPWTFVPATTNFAGTGFSSMTAAAPLILPILAFLPITWMLFMLDTF